MDTSMFPSILYVQREVEDDGEISLAATDDPRDFALPEGVIGLGRYQVIVGKYQFEKLVSISTYMEVR